VVVIFIIVAIHCILLSVIIIKCSFASPTVGVWPGWPDFRFELVDIPAF